MLMASFLDEYVNGNLSKQTVYYPTGEIMGVLEFVNGDKSKATFYHKNGEVNSVTNY